MWWAIGEPFDSGGGAFGSSSLDVDGVDVVVVVVVFVVSGVSSFLFFSSVRSFVKTFVARVIFASDKF